MYRQGLILGSIFAGLAVILGAFGAHALKKVLTPDLLQSFEVAVRYQFYHSFALLITGVIYASIPVKQLRLASLFFTIGTLLFSGSIYILVMLKSTSQIGLGNLGIITPIGGLFFIAGWLMLIFGVIKNK